MKQNAFRTARIARALSARKPIHGDPRSLFYGDPVNVDPEDAAEAIGHEAPPSDVTLNAIVSDELNDAVATDRAAAFADMTPDERALKVNLPTLATWNAFTVINPLLGKISASSLNYMLLKALNEFPYRGASIMGTRIMDESGTTDANLGHRVTIDYEALFGTDPGDHLAALPFFRFAISASTLSARPGAQIKINITGQDSNGTAVDTDADGYTYTFQRLSSTAPIVGVYIPSLVIATRTLPILLIAGRHGTSTPVITIDFLGTLADEQVTVTFPGYATKELGEVSEMYCLPAGQNIQ